VLDRCQKSYCTADPAYGMSGKTGGDDGADYRVAYCDDRRFEPVEVDRGIQAQVQGYEEEGERR
jgi:hypothetical protein